MTTFHSWTRHNRVPRRNIWRAIYNAWVDDGMTGGVAFANKFETETGIRLEVSPEGIFGADFTIVNKEKFVWFTLKSL